MIDMHARVLLPALISPGDKVLEALLLLLLIVRPEINELPISRFVKVSVTPKIFQSTLIEGVAFNIKENV